MTSLEAASTIKAKFGDLISEPVEFRGEISLKVADSEKVAEVCGFAKSIGFSYLVDVSSSDELLANPDDIFFVRSSVKLAGIGLGVCRS